MEARHDTTRDERDRDRGDVPPPDREPPGEQPPDRDAMLSRQETEVEARRPDGDTGPDIEPDHHPTSHVRHEPAHATELGTELGTEHEPPGPVRDPDPDPSREPDHGSGQAPGSASAIDGNKPSPFADRTAGQWDVTDRDAGSAPVADSGSDRRPDGSLDGRNDGQPDRWLAATPDRPEAKDVPETQDLPEARDPDEAEHARPTLGLPTESLTPAPTGPPAATAPTTGTPSAGTAGPADEPLLDPEATREFTAKWEDVQAAFLDAPRQSVTDADRLVTELVDHLAARFAERRDHLERAWSGGDEVTTEDLRVTLQRYRGFFHRLLAS